MNKKSIAERAKILHLLVEGNSMRAASRIADCSLNTTTKLLIEIGEKCAAYQDEALKNLSCRNIQVDEIWSFYYAKNRNLPIGKEGGDIWTWTSICADTKLVPCWLVGPREAECAQEFIADLASRINGRFQLTTDGFSGYREAVAGHDIDFGRIVKKYAEPKGKRFGAYRGYEREIFSGDPAPEKISTCFIERSNLTMRMCIRRFGRKTNAFSKKLINHNHAVSLHFFSYNFIRIHKTLRVTPAMAAGVTDRLWSLEDLAAL